MVARNLFYEMYSKYWKRLNIENWLLKLQNPKRMNDRAVGKLKKPWLERWKERVIELEEIETHGVQHLCLHLKLPS